jgi:CubicO group peptidase (beta-lactamase class C family)
MPLMPSTVSVSPASGSPPVGAARALVARAIHERVFPAAVAEAGSSSGVLWREAFGTLTFDADSRPAADDTIFDLASLTKPLATTTAAMQLVARGALDLEEQVSSLFDEWRGTDRASVTVRDLLEHSSGLPARLVDQPPDLRREFLHEICRIPLEYAPRQTSLYSDLGFILLGFLVEDRAQTSLAEQLDDLVVRLKPDAAGVEDVLAFAVQAGERDRTAPTWPMKDDRRRGRFLVGEVHDNYAAALGGAAGHAGLFGTAPAVGRFARAVLGGARGISGPFSPGIVARMTAKSAVPGSSRALGWDTMLPTSSCGALLSPAAFGHAGFTGTSLWIDPVLDRYFVLLTNRVCHGGTLDQMRRVRRAFHDALATLD